MRGAGCEGDLVVRQRIARGWIRFQTARRARRSPFTRLAGPFGFTEGPVWARGVVLFTDIPSSTVMEFDPRTGACRARHTHTGRANGLALDGEGRVVACAQVARGIVRYEPDGSTTVLADRFDGRRLNSPNDLAIDAGGSIWFSDPRYGERDDMELEHESVYRLEPNDGRGPALVRLTFDTTRPNGLALSLDERSLYVADSPTAPEGQRQLRRYEVRADRTLGAMDVLHDFGPHRGIDGMTVAPDGRIVAACGWRRSGPGPRVAVFAPDGQVLSHLPMPIEPTNVCLGGDQLTDLYVTARDGGLWHTTLEL